MCMLPGVKSVSILMGGECRLSAQAARHAAAASACSAPHDARHGYSRSVLTT